MRLRVLTLLTAAAVTVVAASSASAVAATAGAHPNDLLTMTATTMPLGPGQTEGSEVARGDDVALSSSSGRKVNISGTNSATGRSISVTFTAPSGSPFMLRTPGGVGEYEVYSAPNRFFVGATARFDGEFCRVGGGRLSVYALVYDDAGHIAGFRANYNISCSSGTVIYGNVDVGTGNLTQYGYFSSDPGLTDLGVIRVGETTRTTVHFIHHGDDPSPGVRAALYGSGSVGTTVIADTCTTGPLADGQVCAVTLAVRPRTAGPADFQFGMSGAFAAVVFTATDPDTGTYHPALPQRILDSRTGLGGLSDPLGQNSSFRLDAGLGVSASALVVTLTVTNPTSAGYVTAYPAGTTRPPTSSINFAPRQTVANTLTVPVAADGSIALYNAIGRTDVIVDYVGYYARDDSDLAFTGRGGGLHPTLVERVLDTRTWGHGRLEPGYYATVPVRYRSDGGHIGALSVNVTVTNADAAGFVSTWDASTSTPPETSTLNFTRGATVANSAIVPSSYCQQDDGCTPNAVIGVYNGSSAPIDVLVDISGYYDDGQLPADIRYRPLAAPTRVVDTRSGQGLARFGVGQTQTLVPPTTVAGYDTYALDANVTAVYPTAPTFLTFWPGGYSDYPRPNASALNPFPGQIVANHVSNEVGPGNRVNVYNNAGQVDLVMDVGGTFELFPPTPPDQQGKQGRATVTPAVSVATGATAHPVAAGR